MKVKYRRLMAAMAIALSVSILVSSAYTAESVKDETIYVNLDYQGSVENIYIVNAFKIPADGIITDYGQYRSVKNLTDTGTPSVKGDMIQWKTDPRPGIFYYQGELEDGELPWIFNLEYRLNGFKVEADKLPGAEGRLEITIHAISNEKAHPYFRDNYMAQIQASFDTGLCTNITAPDATIVTVGSTKNIAFTLMPSDTKTFTIAMNVSDFEMNGLNISMMKFSNPIFDNMEDLEGGIGEMTSGITQLVNGTRQIKTGTRELADGVGILHMGMAEITMAAPAIAAGLESFGYGLDTMNSGFEQFTGSSELIREGLGSLDENSYELVNSYSAIEGGLEEMIGQKPELENGLKELKDNKPDLSELSEGAEEFSEGLDALLTVNYDLANKTEALMYKIMTSTDPEVQALFMEVATIHGMVSGIKDRLPELHGGFQVMHGALDEISTGMDTLYDTSVTFGNAALSLMEGAEVLHNGIKSLNEGMREYARGVNELASSYAIFDRSLGDFRDGFLSLAGGFEPLRLGINSMFTALDDVRGGLETLDQNVNQLPDSIEQLENGQRQLGNSLNIAIGEAAGSFITGKDDQKPVSFAAPGKIFPNSVQFVVRTPDIKKPEKKAEEEPGEAPITILDRFKDLFNR